MSSRVYRDTSSIPNSPVWELETQWIKIRINDVIDKPLYFEIWVSDPDNTIQD